MALIIGSGITIGSGISIQPTDFDYERTGLLLHLDAGIPASYPGSGSTWTDLVASKTFTLYNSPTYSSTKGGYLNFNSASSQYAQSVSSLGVNLTTWTVEAWFSYVTTTGSNPTIVTEVQGSNKVNYVLGVPDGVTAPRISAGTFATNWRSLTPGYLPTANNWYQAVGTFDGTTHTFNLYINGSFNSTQTLTAPSASYGSGASGIRLMKRWDGENYWSGGLGVVRIYNNVLTSTQVTRNWNYQRSRFGL
jgi:hypothetical protein